MRRNEQGMALIIALLILVVISLMGIVSLRSSIFSAKIATGSQVDALSFEGAETALSEAYRELEAMPGDQLYGALSGGVLERCVTAGNTRQEGVCGKDDFLDSRELIQVSSATRLDGYQPISGGQVSTSGGGVVFVDYQLAMLGESEVASFAVSDHHLQEALKRGIKPSSEIE